VTETADSRQATAIRGKMIQHYCWDVVALSVVAKGVVAAGSIDSGGTTPGVAKICPG
jgi:hypothetical protein